MSHLALNLLISGTAGKTSGRPWRGAQMAVACRETLYECLLLRMRLSDVNCCEQGAVRGEVAGG